MSVDPVTARWTGALFNLAQGQSVLSDVQGNLDSLAEALRPASVQAWLLGVEATVSEKRTRLASLVQSFQPLTRNFVNLLFERRREQVLPRAAEAFRQRHLRERGAVEGTVEAVRPVAPEALDGLAASLGRALGKQVSLDSRVNPDLVGGVRVFVGTKMIDYSVQGRLEGLRRTLMEAPLPQTSSES